MRCSLASELDERKKRILKVLTDDIFASAEPVVSRTIARRYDLGLSRLQSETKWRIWRKADIWNSYTSAGRVLRKKVSLLCGCPNVHAFSWMSKNRADLQRIGKISSRNWNHNPSDIEDLSTVHQISFDGPRSQINRQIFRHIQLVKLSESTILVYLLPIPLCEIKLLSSKMRITEEELDQFPTCSPEITRYNLRDIRVMSLKNSRWRWFSGSVL